MLTYTLSVVASYTPLPSTANLGNPTASSKLTALSITEIFIQSEGSVSIELSRVQIRVSHVCENTGTSNDKLFRSV